MTSTSTHAPRAGSPARRPAHARAAWHTVTRLAGLAVTVLISSAAALAVIIAAATHFSRDGGYTAFGHPVMTMLSGSMTPVIRTGDLVIDDPVTAAQARGLRPGQIVSVREAPGSTVIITHRIVAVKAAHGSVSYLTKGDANNAPDTTVRAPSDVIGVFRFAVPRGGYALSALHRPLVLGLLLASPVLWFLAGPLYRLAKRTDEPAASAGGGKKGRP